MDSPDGVLHRKEFLWWAPLKEGETSGFTATDDRASSAQGKTLGLQTRKLKSERIHHF